MVNDKTSEETDINQITHDFSKSLYALDIDPTARRKIKHLAQATQKAFENQNENALHYLEYQYQEGVQKIVDMGLDIAKTLTLQLATPENKPLLQQGFEQAKKTLVKQKQENLTSKSASSRTDISFETTESNEIIELPSSLPATFIAYQKLEALLAKNRKTKLGTELKKALDDSHNSLQAIYLRSPNLQTLVEVSLNFSEKLTLARSQDSKPAFESIRQTLSQLTQEAAFLPKDPAIEAASGPIQRPLRRLGAGKKGLEPQKTIQPQTKARTQVEAQAQAQTFAQARVLKDQKLTFSGSQNTQIKTPAESPENTQKPKTG